MNSLCHFCSNSSRHFFKEIASRQFFSSPVKLNSGKFRKMKPPTAAFLTRTQEKKVTNKTDTVFDPDYLDKMVDKMLNGKSRPRLSFLLKDKPASLTSDLPHESRENVIEDWNHIHETVTDLGVPEMADVIGGQMFAGGHLRSTTTSCLTLRLADNLNLLTDRELQHLIHAISMWPADVGGSETLQTVLDNLDIVCSERCENWNLMDNLRLALIWVRYSFRPEQCHFTCKVLQIGSSQIHELRLSELIPYLLLLSYMSQFTAAVASQMSQDQLEITEKYINKNFFNLDQTELAIVYSALNSLSLRKPEELKQKIQETYGFRL